MLSSWPAPGRGFGVAWMVQEEAENRSASQTSAPERFSELPTAVQAALAEHDTDTSSANWVPEGLGVACIDQCAPSHRSAKVIPAVAGWLS